jgi:hypothetical protein
MVAVCFLLSCCVCRSGEVQEQLAAAKQGKPQAPLEFVRRARRDGSHLPR